MAPLTIGQIHTDTLGSHNDVLLEIRFDLLQVLRFSVILRMTVAASPALNYEDSRSGPLLGCFLNSLMFVKLTSC